MQRAKEFQRKLGERQATGGIIPNVLFVNNPGFSDRKNLERTYALNSNNFPVIPLARDFEGDTEFKIKGDLRNPGKYGTSVIDSSTPVTWTDKDTNYFKKKQAAEELAEFNAWCRNRVNLTSSYAELDWAQRTMPFLFDPQEELLEQKLDDCNKYAKIRLRGPQTEEDWEFMYMVETGVIELPKGPVWDPFNEALVNAGIPWKVIDGDEEMSIGKIQHKVSQKNYDNYKRGLFSPLNPRTPEKGGLSANRMNKTAAKGMAGSNYVGPMGIVPPLEPDYNLAYGPAKENPALGGLRYLQRTNHLDKIVENNFKDISATAAINSVPFNEPMRGVEYN